MSENPKVDFSKIDVSSVLGSLLERRRSAMPQETFRGNAPGAIFTRHVRFQDNMIFINCGSTKHNFDTFPELFSTLRQSFAVIPEEAQFFIKEVVKHMISKNNAQSAEIMFGPEFFNPN